MDDLVWRRPGYPGSWPNRLKNDWEGVYHFAKTSKLAAFNPTSAGRPSDRCINKTGAKRSNHTGNNFGGHDERKQGVALPSNVIVTQVSGESIHEAAFPKDLADFFVKVYSNDGDAVFDPFCGSGTTLVSCQDNGRLGYGVEISPKYADVTLSRLEECFGLQAERL
ncbi:site-specific DNA-methyltransferase [Humisphaera borealis]|uniref:Methyltransferase n=1 Tax=Humisphaera borealis TaxID=2807512 RepID=A0A7M2WZ62_9BACT|nr:site-specific DNA-methyltransferase [Humisphaera borealis]